MIYCSELLNDERVYRTSDGTQFLRRARKPNCHIGSRTGGWFCRLAGRNGCKGTRSYKHKGWMRRHLAVIHGVTLLNLQRSKTIIEGKN